jgi:hypothetical protein
MRHDIGDGDTARGPDRTSLICVCAASIWKEDECSMMESRVASYTQAVIAWKWANYANFISLLHADLLC